MPPRKRSVNVDGSPKVYVDIDDVSWRIKSEVVDEAEPTGVPRSPGKSPYSLRNSPRIPQIVPSEEEGLESSDGDFLSSSDEYQPESDGDQSESDPGDQWGIVPGDQSDIDPGVEWDETDDSELEWTDVKTEPGSGLVRCESEDRIIYPRVSRKSLESQKEKISRNQRTNEVSSRQMSLRSSGLRTRSNKVYTAKLMHSREKSSKNRKARFQSKHQNQNTTIQHEENDQRKSKPDENATQMLDEMSETSVGDLDVDEMDNSSKEHHRSEKGMGPSLSRRTADFSDDLGQQHSKDPWEEDGKLEENGTGQPPENNMEKPSKRRAKISPAIELLSYSGNISILVRKTLTRHERKTWCLFCGRKVFQLTLHLQCKHPKEREVVEMKKYGINTKLRKKRLQAIFDKGLCRHNDKIIEAGKGTLIPLRRPLNTDGLTVDQFCQGCYVFVDKNFVETHKLSCRGQSVETMDKQGNEKSDLEEEPNQNLLNITDDMINTLREKLKQISKNGQIKVIEEKQHNGGITCAYCHITPCHFSRHIERKHSEEPMVKEVLGHPIGSQERKTEWTKLRNTCHFFHNKSVLEAGSGELVIGYVQANQSKDPSLLEVCGSCYGLFWCLQSHIRRCQKYLLPQAKKKTCECMLVRSVDIENSQNGSPSNRADNTEGTDGTNKTGNSGTGIQWQKRSDGKKKFRKVNCCVYCHTPQYKMYKHYVEKHGAEEEVQKAMKYPKQSKGRRGIFSMLILKGNNEHNKRVLKRGQGTLIPPRKLQEEPDETVAENLFSYCSLCFARVQSVSMWAHMKKHRMSEQVTSQETTTNKEGDRLGQPSSGLSLGEKDGGFETRRIKGTDNVSEGSSEINLHPQDVDNQGVTENLTSEAVHPNQEGEERVENRHEAGNGEEASNKMEHSNREGESNTEEACKGEEARNREEASRSSQGDQPAVGCEMEGERCSVLQPVEQDRDRPEVECVERETSDGREKEVQPTIITVKRGSKEIPSSMKYSADISILLSTIQSFCPYCQKSSINMIKHLQLRHATERDVQEAIKMPIEFEAGKKLWADLIMRGNKEHNDRVMQAGAGDLIPLRRIHRAATLKDYNFCFNCYLFIKKVNHMHKYFCKNSRQTFEDIEEETLRRSAVDSRHNCFCKAAAKAEEAAKSTDKGQRKNTSPAKFHIKSDSAINFDQTKNMEKMKVSKSQCCLYCQKLLVRMAHHLTMAHSDQREVQEALRHPKKSPERRRLFCVLLRRGNYKHNKRVSHLGSGFMIPVSLHRQRFGDHGKFVHCEVCLGLFSTRGLKKHMERHYNEPATTESTWGLFNKEGNQKSKLLPPRSASRKVKDLVQNDASGEMPDENMESSDEEWDRAEFRRLQRAKHRRLQKRKLSQRKDQSDDRARQDNAAEDVATQQDMASTEQGPTKEKKRKVARKGVKLWSDEEMVAIDSFFSKHIEDLRVPGKEQCEAAKQKFPEALMRRDWKGIKFCVYNKIQTRKKQERREEEGDEKSSDKCPWTQPEVCAVEKHMQSFINDLVTPGKLDCLQVKRRCGAVLRGRSWKQIKFYVYNRVLKRRRMQSNE